MKCIAYGFLCACLTSVVIAADDRPAVPESLVPLDAELRGFPGCFGKYGLVLKSREPLTAEQWDAVAGLPVTSFLLSGAFVDKAGLARLAEMKVEGLFLTGCRAEDAEAAAAFTAMTSLRRVGFSHCRVNETVAVALAKHPSLESFTTDNEKLGNAVAHIATAPHLRKLRLAHAAGSDVAAKAIENHPTLESVQFWSVGGATLTEAGVRSLTTIPNLQELAFYYTVVTYEGSLQHLKELAKLERLTMGEVDVSAEDLARLRADLPDVDITYEPMKPGGRTTWEKNLEYRRRQGERAARKNAAAPASSP
jgi:hypothetical protein